MIIEERAEMISEIISKAFENNSPQKNLNTSVNDTSDFP